MQVALGQLQAHLDQHGLPAVLSLFSDTPLFIDDAVQIIRQAAQQQGVSERQRWVQDNSFDWRQLSEQGGSMSLFSQLTLIELELPDGKPGREGGEAIRAYTDQPNQDQIMLILGPRLKQEQQKSKWYQALNQQGLVINANAPERHALPRLVNERASRYQLQLEEQAAQLLADWYEGNLLALDQQLQKLALSDLPQPLSVATIQAAAEDQSRFSVFALQEALIAGDTEASLHRLERLFEEDVEIAILSWMLQREWQQLWQIEQSHQCGIGFAQIAKKLRLWRSQEQLYRNFWQRCRSHLSQINELLARLELAFKRDSGADYRALTTHLILLYCEPETVAQVRLP